MGLHTLSYHGLGCTLEVTKGRVAHSRSVKVGLHILGQQGWDCTLCQQGWGCTLKVSKGGVTHSRSARVGLHILGQQGLGCTL